MRIKIVNKPKVIPVMGKDAFIAFAKEHMDYMRSVNLEPAITIPCGNWYENQGGYIGAKRYGSHFAKFQGRIIIPAFEGRVEINSLRGKTNKKRAGTPSELSFSLDDIAETETSDNFVFYKVATNLKDAQLSPMMELDGLTEEMVRETRRMIYERSALIQIGLFGGKISI